MNYYDKFGKLLDAIQGSGNTITIGILNSENRYLVYDLNPEPNKYNSGVFTKTASPGTYLFEFEDKSKNLKTRSTAKLSGIGTLYYSFEPLSNTELKKTLGSGFRLGNKFIVENEATKIFPISDELAKYSKSTSSGTCFALSSDGLLITNYHKYSILMCLYFP